MVQKAEIGQAIFSRVAMSLLNDKSLSEVGRAELDEIGAQNLLARIICES